eukprot:3941811-Rhodomonas_salina.2
MSGTDVRYGAMRLLRDVRYSCYAMSGTDVEHRAMQVRGGRASVCTVDYGLRGAYGGTTLCTMPFVP